MTRYSIFFWLCSHAFVLLVGIVAGWAARRASKRLLRAAEALRLPRGER